MEKEQCIPKIGETYKMDFNHSELHDMTITDIREVKLFGFIKVTNIYLKGGRYDHITARLRLGQFNKMRVYKPN